MFQTTYKHIWYSDTHRELLQLHFMYMTEWKCLSESLPGLVHCPAMFELKASPQSQRKNTSNTPSIHHSSCSPDSRQQRAISPQADGNGGVGGGPDWQPQCWWERGVCLELPDALLNRSLRDDGKSWVHMQLFVGRKGKKTERCWFFCCVSSTSCWD